MALNTRKLKELIALFSKTTTLIFICSSTYIALFYGLKVSLSISYIWGVLAISFLTTVSYIPFLRDREPGKIQLIVSRIIFYIFVNIVVLCVGFYLDWLDTSNWKSIAGIVATVFCVHLVLWIVGYHQDSQTAAKMNEKLHERKQES